MNLGPERPRFPREATTAYRPETNVGRNEGC